MSEGEKKRKKERGRANQARMRLWKAMNFLANRCYFDSVFL